MRIVSLVPSLTEYLHALGLDEEVVGITKFCVHPEAWFRTKERVGGTKDFKVGKILDLHPDLVIANKEENVKDGIEELRKHCEVLVTEISTVEDAFYEMETIGKRTGKEKEARGIISAIQEKRALLQVTKESETLKVLYLIWRNPYMAAGSDTYINVMLEEAGFMNVIRDTRYPEIKEEDWKGLNPSFIFLSSEPYPFKEKHLAEIRNFCPGARVGLVDGELFSWYGIRMLYAYDYFRNLREHLSR